MNIFQENHPKGIPRECGKAFQGPHRKNGSFSEISELLQELCSSPQWQRLAPWSTPINFSVYEGLSIFEWITQKGLIICLQILKGYYLGPAITDA